MSLPSYDPSPRPARTERGQATAEFALILPLLALILFATIEFGSAFWTYQQVSAAASEGARRAAVSRGVDDPNATVTTTVQNASPNLDGDAFFVDIDSTWDPGDTVTVSVTYPLPINVVGVSFGDGDVTIARSARVES